MEMVSVTMAAGPVAPSKFFIAPGGRSLNNRGYTMGLVAGYSTAVMSRSEAEILTNPNDAAVGPDGNKLTDANGKAILNKALVTSQTPGRNQPSIMEKAKFVVGGGESSGESKSKASASATPAAKKESK